MVWYGMLYGDHVIRKVCVGGLEIQGSVERGLGG